MTPLTLPTAILGLPGGSEWIVILIIALLLFGRRLPEVMRSMGRGVVEFKKGIKGIEEEVELESSRPSQSIQSPAQGTTPTSAATADPAPASSDKEER